MFPRHHLNDPELILGTSNFHDFSWFSRNVPVFRMVPSSSGNKVDTILKNIKHDYGWYRVYVIWSRLSLDNLGQRVARTADRRNPLWPLWRPPVTGRRVLRTIFMQMGISRYVTEPSLRLGSAVMIITNMPFTQDQISISLVTRRAASV